MRDAITTRRSRRLVPVTVGLLAAVAVFALLLPPSAAAWGLLPLEDRLALEATEISSAKVCGASECRELSDPEAATALAAVRTRRQGGRQVVHFPQGADAPERGLPWYMSTLTIPAEGGGEVDRVSVSITVVPAAGLMRVNGPPEVWVTLPSESKEAYAKLTAGLAPRPARTLPNVGEDALPVARVDKVVTAPSAATPEAGDGSTVWIVALAGGVLAALMAGLLVTLRHRRASTPLAAPG